MASSLNHPHIVTVYDAGEFEEQETSTGFRLAGIFVPDGNGGLSGLSSSFAHLRRKLQRHGSAARVFAEDRLAVVVVGERLLLAR